MRRGILKIERDWWWSWAINRCEAIKERARYLNYVGTGLDLVSECREVGMGKDGNKRRALSCRYWTDKGWDKTNSCMYDKQCQAVPTMRLGRSAKKLITYILAWQRVSNRAIYFLGSKRSNLVLTLPEWRFSRIFSLCPPRLGSNSRSSVCHCARRVRGTNRMHVKIWKVQRSLGLQKLILWYPFCTKFLGFVSKWCRNEGFSYRLCKHHYQS